MKVQELLAKEVLGFDCFCMTRSPKLLKYVVNSLKNLHIDNGSALLDRLEIKYGIIPLSSNCH